MTRAAGSGRGGMGAVLFLVATLLFAAGVSRLSLGVASAVAAEDTPALPSPPAPSETRDAGALFEALRAREVQLAQRERALEDRAEALRGAEAQLRAQLDELKAAESRLAATLSQTENAAENDLVRLTTVFEHMKPPQAAALFSTMETEFAAGFIARLDPQFAGEVMAELEPTLAYGISAVLAGRNALTPRD